MGFREKLYIQQRSSSEVSAYGLSRHIFYLKQYFTCTIIVAENESVHGAFLLAGHCPYAVFPGCVHIQKNDGDAPAGASLLKFIGG